MSVIAQNMYDEYNKNMEDNNSKALTDEERAQGRRRKQRGSNFRFNEGDTIEFARRQDTNKLDIREVTITDTRNGRTNTFVSCTVLKNGSRLVQICESNLEDSIDVFTESPTGKAIASGEPPVVTKDPISVSTEDIVKFFEAHDGKTLKCRRVIPVNTKEYGTDRLTVRRAYEWVDITNQTNA